MLDRTVSPEYIDTSKVTLEEPDCYMINEKIPLFVYRGTDQKVLKIDIIMKSGKYYEEQNGIAYFTAKMLKGGTKKIDSNKIAYQIDYFGSHLNFAVGRDFSHIQVVTESKHLSPLLDLIEEVINNSIFPNSYLKIIKNIEKNNISLEDKKNNILSHKILRELIYGENHPYGQQLKKLDIDKITSETLKKYFHNSFLSDCEVFVSGLVKDHQLDEIISTIKTISIHKSKYIKTNFFSKPSKKIIGVKNSVQSSISMGKTVPLKNNKDFKSIYIVNELLGGYFGSRLMMNIREEKGYTYGIYSQILPMTNSTLFYISTDVAKNYTKKTCEEIKNEIIKLQRVPIENEELENFKRHLKGTLLLSMDGPYSKMDKFIKVRNHRLNGSYYKELYEHINSIDQEMILNISKKYFDFDSLCQVIVGGE